ncbi:MAG: hypothetical protein AB2L11_01805 [Syntrophobacteraceae bacterium]
MVKRILARLMPLKPMNSINLKLVFAALACIALCWSLVYFLPRSANEDNNGADRKLTEVEDQASSSGSVSAKRNKEIDDHAISRPSLAPGHEEGSLAAHSAGQHKHLNNAIQNGSGQDELIIPPSEDGKPGLTVRDVQYLHEQQEYEKRANATMDEIVTLSSDDNEAALTVREIQALHEQQEYERKANATMDETLPLSSEDAEPGLTVREIQALHEQQEYERKANATMDETLPLSSEDAEPGLTVREIQALHEEQEHEGAASATMGETLPLSSGDTDPGLTVGELQALHEQQEYEKGY